MNPSHIYFKEIDIDQDNTFTANFTKETEIENVIFNKDSEYGISGLNINSILSDEKLLKIENVKEQNKVSLEIQELIKNYKEPDLTLFMSHSETKTVEIPFVKKSESDLPRIELTYYNTTTTTTKNEELLMYGYIGHLKKFGFDWIQNDLGVRYGIKINNADSKKIKKKLTLSRSRRKKNCLDQSRVWNMKMTWKKMNLV